MFKLVNGFAITISLSLAPILGMAFSAQSADACVRCVTVGNNCNCVTAGIGNWYQTCTPPPGVGVCERNGPHYCTLSGGCFNP